MEKFRQRSCIWYLTNSKRKARYKRKLNAAEDAIRKQLDLSIYLKKERFQSLAIFALLDWRLNHIVRSLSKVAL